MEAVLYDAKTTLVDHPNQFSTDQKHDAIGALVYDSLLFGAGRAASRAQRFSLDALDAARQGLFQANSWGSASKPPTLFTNVAQGNLYNFNSFMYAQSVAFSQTTGKPSYTGTGTQAGVGNSNYASQTYVTPSGAVVDWAGNVIVAPPPAQPSSPPNKKK